MLLNFRKLRLLIVDKEFREFKEFKTLLDTLELRTISLYFGANKLLSWTP